MHFVGIDLAWGERNPTGLAVLDQDGRLLHVASVRTDDEVAVALTPFVDGACVVAIDAPLIVRNPSGNRGAEAALNRDFAPFQAGTHPSNTGRPLFHPMPRGERVARVLHLPISTDPTLRRRAIEVYPHAATISLFRLGRTLKYKRKPGRTLDGLRAELSRFLQLLETLSTAEPPLFVTAHAGWADLVATVRDTVHKNGLRLVEDQVDAVLCAYVALLAARRPDLLTTYGNEEQGFIVTPTLPPGLTPDRATRPSPGAPA